MTSPELRPVEEHWPVASGQWSVDSDHSPLTTGHRPLATVYWPLLALLILLLAAAFRLVALGDVPPGLAQDEVLDADIALFIRGGEHALFFRHGYGHEPLYHYLAAPFAPLLGDNWLAIRLPSVYLGLLLVALTRRWARRDYGTVAAVVAGLGLEMCIRDRSSTSAASACLKPVMS